MLNKIQYINYSQNIALKIELIKKNEKYKLFNNTLDYNIIQAFIVFQIMVKVIESNDYKYLKKNFIFHFEKNTIKLI